MWRRSPAHGSKALPQRWEGKFCPAPPSAGPSFACATAAGRHSEADLGLRSRGTPTINAADEERLVLEAFHKALLVDQSMGQCYQAGVRAWRILHPDQSPSYAARIATAIMLRDRVTRGFNGA